MPFSTDGRVDIRELQEDFCRANKNLYVSPMPPTYEQELEYVRASEEKIARGEEFENFFLEKSTNKLLGAGGIKILETGELNIGIWIRENEQGKGYASEILGCIDCVGKEKSRSGLPHSFAQSSKYGKSETR